MARNKTPTHPQQTITRLVAGCHWLVTLRHGSMGTPLRARIRMRAPSITPQQSECHARKQYTDGPAAVDAYSFDSAISQRDLRELTAHCRCMHSTRVSTSSALRQG